MNGARIGVFGLGNVLRRDDGFGPTVVRRLASEWEFPPDVDVRDLGTPGLDFAAQLLGLDAVVLVDTLVRDDAPGTLHVLDDHELPRRPGPGSRVTQHEADLGGALAMAELAGAAPRVVRLVGVVPLDLEMGPGFSPEVEGALDEACEVVRTELGRLGVRVARRPEAQLRPTGDWWSA